MYVCVCVFVFIHVLAGFCVCVCVRVHALFLLCVLLLVIWYLLAILIQSANSSFHVQTHTHMQAYTRFFPMMSLILSSMATVSEEARERRKAQRYSFILKDWGWQGCTGGWGISQRTLCHRRVVISDHSSTPWPLGEIGMLFLGFINTVAGAESNAEVSGLKINTHIQSIHLTTFLFFFVLNHPLFCDHVISFNSLRLCDLFGHVPGFSDHAAALTSVWSLSKWHCIDRNSAGVRTALWKTSRHAVLLHLSILYLSWTTIQLTAMRAAGFDQDVWD